MRTGEEGILVNKSLWQPKSPTTSLCVKGPPKEQLGRIPIPSDLVIAQLCKKENKVKIEEG